MDARDAEEVARDASTAVIEVTGLVKRFGRTVALDGLDLEVGRGEVHGFLGPNGSGKTTTLRILLGLLRADGGRCTVLGRDPWHDAVGLHRRIAYVPGEVALWPTLSGGEVLDLLARLHGSTDRARRDLLVERFALDPTRRGRAYSRGNRQKVALVAALASDAELLLLDEPAAGLDPLVDAEFRACVREAAAAGRTVLLSSHQLGEVEALCDRVSIIRAGRTVESGSLAEMRHLARFHVTAEVRGPVPELSGLTGVHGLRVDGAQVRAEVDPPALGEVVRAFADAGLVALTSRPPSLDELFLRHYGPPPADRTSVPAGAVTS